MDVTCEDAIRPRNGDLPDGFSFVTLAQSPVKRIKDKLRSKTKVLLFARCRYAIFPTRACQNDAEPGILTHVPHSLSHRVLSRYHSRRIEPETILPSAQRL